MGMDTNSAAIEVDYTDDATERFTGFKEYDATSKGVLMEFDSYIEFIPYENIKSVRYLGIEDNNE